MNTFVSALGFGVAYGVLISLGALGFTVQFGLSNVLNVAYGALMTIAAYLEFELVSDNINPWASLVLVMLLSAVISLAYYRAMIRPLLRRGVGLGSMIIATFSAGLTLQYIIIASLGPTTRTIAVAPGATIHIGAVVLSTLQVILAIVAIVVMLIIHMTLTMTKVGRALRATADNRELARHSGVRVERVTSGAWLLSGGLCGLAGAALAITLQTFSFTVGATFLILVIAAAVVGGMGHPYGAMIGGLCIGIASQLASAYWSPSYSIVVALILLVGVMLLRPRGLWGAPTRAVSLLD